MSDDQTLLATLADIVGEQNLRTGKDQSGFLTDWRGRYEGHALCTVLPASTQEVSEIVKLAVAEEIDVFPQGGNTSLCYGTVPESAGTAIVLALSRLNKIREIDPLGNVLVVESGAILASVHEAANDHNRQFPLHLGSEGSAQIGGLIATNAGGTGAVRYGSMRDLVYGVEAVLPDGRIVNALRALKKDNTGYDLKHLFIGSEGTLGVVTAASLKLFPVMNLKVHAWLSIKDPTAALNLFSRLQQEFDTSILAYELLNGAQVELVLAHVERTRIPFDQVPEWSILLELGAVSQDVPLTATLEGVLEQAFENGLIDDAAIAQNSSQAGDFWHVRHSVSEANKVAGMGLTHDVALPISKVPDFISQSNRFLTDNYPTCRPVIVSHMGDGNVHMIAFFTHEGFERLDGDTISKEIMLGLHNICMALDGTFSAEHGIGKKLNGELRRLLSSSEYDAMQAVKNALDPNNRMSPGVIF